MDAPYSDALRELQRLPGARYSCIADAVSGRVLAERGDGAVDPAVVLGWGGTVLRDLAGTDELDDLIVTGARTYHLVRRAPAVAGGPLLVYVCLERARSNLALARRALSGVAVLPANGPPAAVGAGGAPLPATAARPPVPAPSPPAPPPTALPPTTLPPTALPLPRRAPAPVPAPPPVAAAPTTGPRWSRDMSTMRRLLVGLRSLK